MYNRHKILRADSEVLASLGWVQCMTSLNAVLKSKTEDRRFITCGTSYCRFGQLRSRHGWGEGWVGNGDREPKSQRGKGGEEWGGVSPSPAD